MNVSNLLAYSGSCPTACLAVLLFVSPSTAAQSAQSGNIPAGGASPSSSAAAPAATNAPAPDPTTLTQLQHVSQSTLADLKSLRIEKWKADATLKNQAINSSESLQRNLSAALPGMIDQVRVLPASFPANFKLYRNVNALCDVLSELTNTARVFGTRDEYQSLSHDNDNLKEIRRLMGDRMENLANYKENLLVKLQTQVQSQAQAPPAPTLPKKIVVDDTATQKKPAKKKTTTTPSGQATGQTASPQSGTQPPH
ncbi:MAG TPA: hypothetical protein VEG30_05265 [Terriglobales bacterium]|nr:hypothetical protein [Terriglobales bacterium]